MNKVKGMNKIQRQKNLEGNALNSAHGEVVFSPLAALSAEFIKILPGTKQSTTANAHTAHEERGQVLTEVARGRLFSWLALTSRLP